VTSNAVPSADNTLPSNSTWVCMTDLHVWLQNIESHYLGCKPWLDLAEHIILTAWLFPQHLLVIDTSKTNEASLFSYLLDPEGTDSS
jgi:hypothetical protein